jgi:hypothetical protein
MNKKYAAMAIRLRHPPSERYGVTRGFGVAGD